jgi:hypothetical protein
MAEQYQDIDTTNKLLPLRNVAEYIFAGIRQGIIFTNIALKNGSILENVLPLQIREVRTQRFDFYQLMIAQKTDQGIRFISVDLDSVNGIEVIPDHEKPPLLYFHYFTKEGLFETPVRNVRPTGNIFIGVAAEFNPIRNGKDGHHLYDNSATVFEGNALYMEVIDLDDGQLKYFPLWRMIGVLANWNPKIFPPHALRREVREKPGRN